MDDATFKAKLARLRASRTLPVRDMSLGTLLTDQRRRARRTMRSHESLDEAWRRLAPSEIASQSRVLGVSRGTLTVRVADEGVRFHADRWLRSGGMSALITASPVTLIRVRLTPA